MCVNLQFTRRIQALHHVDVNVVHVGREQRQEHLRGDSAVHVPNVARRTARQGHIGLHSEHGAVRVIDSQKWIARCKATQPLIPGCAQICTLLLHVEARLNKQREWGDAIDPHT